VIQSPTQYHAISFLPLEEKTFLSKGQYTTHTGSSVMDAKFFVVGEIMQVVEVGFNQLRMVEGKVVQKPFDYR
jgi:hypothetical protein